jgi:hypothetical protein
MYRFNSINIKIMDKYIVIEDKGFFKFFLLFIQKIFIKVYINQGFIYIDKENKKFAYCSDIVKWLEKIKIKTYSQKRADKLSWKFFHKKYPQYENYIQLF